MKNRLLDYFMTSSDPSRQSTASLEEWSEKAQSELTFVVRQVEDYVKEHPAIGIGATFTLGVILGWIVKRK